MNSKMNLVLSATIIAALAGGCTNFKNGPDQALSIQQAHPISVDSQIVTLTLNATATGLSSMDQARLRAFASSYIKDGHGTITITSPGSQYADGNANLLVGDIRTRLNDLGIDQAALNTTTYNNASAGTSDIIVSYTHYVATASACGLWSDLRERDKRNLMSPNFGCSSQNNLAAMIGDPRDLVDPPALTNPDSEFRIRGVESFRAGEVTSSQTDGDIETQVAN